MIYFLICKGVVSIPGAVIPTSWNFPGIILNDETYLYLAGRSLFSYLPELFSGGKKLWEWENFWQSQWVYPWMPLPLRSVKGLSVERAEPKHLLSAGLWFGGA